MNIFGSQSTKDDKSKEIRGLILSRNYHQVNNVLGAAKDANRQISRESRAVDKEIRDIEKCEKDLVAKIKTCHKRGKEVSLLHRHDMIPSDFCDRAI